MSEGPGSRSRTRGLAALALGAATFWVVHAFLAGTWQRLFQPAVLETPWFMGSRGAIVVTQVALGVVALALAVRRASWRWRFADVAWLTLGATLALVATFIALGPARVMSGPTSLWPVALVSAVLLLAPAVLAGTFLGGYLRDSFGRPGLRKK